MRKCTTCLYEPEWGKNGYDRKHGECRWPCPPCLKWQMKPVNKEKLFDCPAHVPKEE